MKRALAIISVIIILLAVWFLFFKTNDKTASGDEPEVVSVAKHSAEFNGQVTTVINAYMTLKNAFVDGDTSAIKAEVPKFVSSMDSINPTELQKMDSSVLMAIRQNISDIKANAQPILQESDLTEMRHDFSMVSENLYPFLKTVGYEGEKLFWQNCPMAFGEDKPANWLSTTSEILNPYLGKNHPEYKSAMLHCGENKDSLYLK